MTEPIPYDELLAAHQEVVRQRDLARRVAVALEQELADTTRRLAGCRGLAARLAERLHEMQVMT